MPGYDKTGPEGKGPLTGGGRGLCGSGKSKNLKGRGVGQGGLPRGGGAGRCWGGGARRRHLDEIDPRQDLENYAKELENELSAVKKAMRKEN